MRLRLAAFVLLWAACGASSAPGPATSAVPGPAQRGPACDPDNGGLILPAGFCALRLGDSLGPVRHLAIAPNGDLFVARSGQSGGLALMRDTSGDGRIDVVRQIYPGGGTGVLLTVDAVYYAPNDRVIRFPWRAGSLDPAGPADTVVMGLPATGHGAKTLAMGRDGQLYVNIGSSTNSCQVQNRQARSPGVQPCTELEGRGGIWRFDPRKAKQTQADGQRFATGLRNAEAIAIEPVTGTLYAAVHGRDQLTQNWGFSEEDGAENPAEEFGPITQGADYGWPYCYYDPRSKVKVVSPEYGGDGKQVGDCDDKNQPAIGFPAHWAPISTMFYTGSQFPNDYRGGAFIAFHGSWNRGTTPDAQQGFRVVFAPFQNGRPTGTYDTFARPAGAHNSLRPTGLAVGPDGSLYIGADREQRIWRVFYWQ
jgi:glucose/arabinose dehydrogenase